MGAVKGGWRDGGRGDRRSSDLASRGELTDELLEQLGEEYATSVSMDWVDELAARYNLEVTIWAGR